MHPYLIRLGISLQVQRFFAPYWRTDEKGALLFEFGDQQEHYGMGYHRVPLADTCWIAGDQQSACSNVFIAYSAMEAICFFASYHHRFPVRDRLLFIATGGSLPSEKLCFLLRFANLKVNLIQENSVLGHIWALKLVAAVRQLPLGVYNLPENRVRIVFRNHAYDFDATDFSLSRFEKACHYRFKGRFYYPLKHLTFLDALKANPFRPNL